MTASNRHLSLTLPLLVAVALGAAFLLTASPAEACMESTFCESCPDLCGGAFFCSETEQICLCDVEANEIEAPRVAESSSTELIFTSRRTVSIVLPSYSTTSLRPATQCVTALSPIPGVESVDQVVNFDGRTGLPFEEVTFFPSAGPGEAVARLAAEKGLADEADGPWHAFQSHITGTVRDGVPNSFVVDVTLEPGVSPAEFVKTVREEGLFLTSSSDADGVPTPHHNTFRRIGANEIVVTGMELDKPTPDGTPKAPRKQ